MFKNKIFLSGLGIGLIVGAILLQLMNSVPIPSNQSFVLDDPAEQNQQEDPSKTTEGTDEAESDKSKDEPKIVVQNHWGFTIAKGTQIQEIINMLHKMKLIEDRDGFLKELKAKMPDHYIYEGYYVFENKPNHQEIIRMIMKLE